MLIEVTEIHPVKPGGKVARLVAADGVHYEIWPEKLPGVTVGQTYEADIREREYSGRTIKSIQAIKPAPHMSKKSDSLNTSREHVQTTNTSASSGEAEYVGPVLAALIAKGEVTVNQVPAYTMRLREVWRQQ